MQCNAAWQVVLKLKTPWRDGTPHLVMSPLEFMQRLAPLGQPGGARRKAARRSRANVAGRAPRRAALQDEEARMAEFLGLDGS